MGREPQRRRGTRSNRTLLNPPEDTPMTVSRASEIPTKPQKFPGRTLAPPHAHVNDPRPRGPWVINDEGIESSRSISRVLSRTIIHLGRSSPNASSGLPESSADHAIGFLFGLAPGGVYLADAVTRHRGALLPHPFTLTSHAAKRSTLCCTFRGLTPPRGYLAPCPVEPGLSSRAHGVNAACPRDCLTGSRSQTTPPSGARPLPHRVHAAVDREAAPPIARPSLAGTRP